jgi:hypothetical protein
LINIPYKIIVKNFGVPIATIESSGGITEIPFTSVPLVNGTNTPFEYTFYVSSSFTFSYVSFLKLRRVTYSFVFGFESRIQDLNSSTSTITSVMNISNNLPKIKVIDFMKGLFNMFKLVVIADQSNNIYINTLVNNY